jgi:hypothetical protein
LNEIRKGVVGEGDAAFARPWPTRDTTSKMAAVSDRRRIVKMAMNLRQPILICGVVGGIADLANEKQKFDGDPNNIYRMKMGQGDRQL